MLQAGYTTPQREIPHTNAQGQLTRASGFPKGVRLILGVWTTGEPPQLLRMLGARAGCHGMDGVKMHMYLYPCLWVWK